MNEVALPTVRSQLYRHRAAIIRHAVIIFFLLTILLPLAWVLLLSVGVFVLAGAMRLARFNLTTDKPRSGWFAGIPITAAGGGLLSPAVILLVRYEDIAAALPLHAYLPVVMFVLALAMMSTIRLMFGRCSACTMRRTTAQ